MKTDRAKENTTKTCQSPFHHELTKARTDPETGNKTKHLHVQLQCTGAVTVTMKRCLVNTDETEYQGNILSIM